MDAAGASRRQVFRLSSLPADLLIAVLEKLPFLDQPALAATNRYLRTILHPIVTRHALQRFPYLLVWAAWEGLEDLVRVLLESGGDPNVFVVVAHKLPSHPPPPHPRPVVMSMPPGFPEFGRPEPLPRPVLAITTSPLDRVFKHTDWSFEYQEQVETPGNHDDDNSSVSARPPRHNERSRNKDPNLRVCTFTATHDGQHKVPGTPFWIESFGKGAAWCTALHVATFYGHIRVVELLVSHGADMEAPSSKVCACFARGINVGPGRPWPVTPHWTALHIALCQRSNDVALYLLSQGAYRGDPLESTYTSALETAVRHGCVPVVRHLLEEVIEQSGPEGLRRLHPHLLCISVENTGILEVTQMLLSHGFSPNITDQYGCTPFLIACQSEQIEAAEALLDETDDINWAPPESPMNCRPIDWLCQESLLRHPGPGEPLSLRPRRVKLVNRTPEAALTLIARMIDRGAEISSTLHVRRSSLHIAAQAGNLNVLSLLKAAGPEEIFAEGPGGDFPLLTAMGLDGHSHSPLTRIPENWACLRWFLQQGADPNQQRKRDGLSPLLALCSSPLSMISDERSREACQILLKAGADPNLCQRDGKRAFISALELHRTKTCRQMMAHGVKHSLSPQEMYALFDNLLNAVRAHSQALKGGYYPKLHRDVFITVERLRDHGDLLIDLVTDPSLVSLADFFWQTTQWPSYRLSLAFLKKLPLDLDYSPFDKPNTTCLHNVLKSSPSRLTYSYDLELISKLIEHGVDVNKGDPVMCAITNHKWAAAVKLLQAGAKIPKEKGDEVLRTLISVSWFASIDDLFRMVLMNLGIFEPRYRNVGQSSACSSSRIIDQAQSRQEKLDQLLMRACKAPRIEIIRTLLNAGADPNFMGATNVTGNGSLKTPLRALIRSAQPREDEIEAPCDDHVIAERFFESFRLLCERGAILEMPRKLPRPLHFRSQRRSRDLSLVEKATESWPFTYFQNAILRRCDFFTSGKDDHPRRITVVFRDEVHKRLRVRRDFGSDVRAGQALTGGGSDGNSSVAGADTDTEESEDDSDDGHEANDIVEDASVHGAVLVDARGADNENDLEPGNRADADDQDDTSSTSTEDWYYDLESRAGSDDPLSDSDSDASGLSAYASSFEQ